MGRFKISFKNGKIKYLKYCCLIWLILGLVHVFLTLRYICMSHSTQNKEMEDEYYFDNMLETTSDSDNKKVPRIVHQMWKTNRIPEQWSVSSMSWKITNPSIFYMFWNDTLLEKFIFKSYPWLLDLYKSYPYNIQRADMARYILLFHFGGVYADLDVECRTSLNDILYKMDTDNFTIGIAATTPYGFSNDLIFAKPRSNFLKQVILGLKSSNRWYYLPYWTVMFSTGSLYFTSVVEKYSQKDTEIYVIPKDCYNGACFSHLVGGSWHSLDGKIFWSLFSVSFDSDLVIILFCILCILLIIRCMFRK